MIEKIIDFENGNMTEEETIDFFQNIIDSGLVWDLQGFYGRMANNLIEEGVCTPQTETYWR